MKKYIDLEEMVNVNCSTVLDIIHKNTAVSRKQITQLSGLSWGGMTKIVNKLLEKEYIVETKLENSSSGRTPGSLSINKSKNFVVGLDINKTGLKAIVTDLTGEVLKTFEADVKALDKDLFLGEITDFLDSVFKSFKKGEIVSMGIALQGIVDYKQGISVKFPEVAGWENVPIKNLLEEKFEVPVFVEHDPDCILYSFLKYGTLENTVLFRIDKSIGMAVAVGGRIIKGRGIFEIAHNIVVPKGKECYCGLRGCLQAYVSDCMGKEELDSNAINDFLPVMALTIRNMTNVFNADRIILTGELMKYSELFETKLMEELADNNLSCMVELLDAENRAVKGASQIATDKTISSLFI